MGLRMDIHNPSVPANAAAASTSNGVGNKAALMELMTKKEALESELEALGNVLQSHGVNMNTTLTTFDGYPRDDLDIAQIRTTRARIIHLRNDHKALMSQIEKGLHEFHAAHQASLQETSRSEAPSTSRSVQALSGQPAERPATLPEPAFAKVNSIVSNSPADTAGLKAGDGIISFGDVNFMNHANLSGVAALVQNNQGKELAVKVHRLNATTGSTESLELKLIPRANWGGRGLLGCHLLPV